MTADSDTKITPELLLQGYASGVFPMSESVDDPDIFWVDPQMRGIFPLDGFHVSRSLARTIKRAPYQVTFDERFGDVVKACADRDETWINAEIFDLYSQLHELGFAHSVEVMDGDTLIGGLYGVTLASAFFGESMFSRRTDASKIALTYLIARLNYGDFTLLDTQFQTDHLKSLGAQEITRNEYRERLAYALEISADFYKLPLDVQPSEVLHLSSHTS
ncbi:leucyl/phenylalanyl-tRNA--protein transferase [Amylibacter sp. SFDW26]|uniref:leucyl/phenylalanyl-tRNA--protein transferase n=1 Tax=Amylibacter sp. SFDW26 TaxID=2652722 RepID=UPI001261F5BE|nr:leucyl/phenylalanyl-tRNA--protein transferase [Amylibacter sp. SFDW26]KAB7615719.1 leucyl/phenylalanyl-tRNA--protein transferase [Amylibacter sp. SFDW26]